RGGGRNRDRLDHGGAGRAVSAGGVTGGALRKGRTGDQRESSGRGGNFNHRVQCLNSFFELPLAPRLSRQSKSSLGTSQKSIPVNKQAVFQARDCAEPGTRRSFAVSKTR